MSEKTLKFNSIRINKKEFHKSEQAIDLNFINVDQIVVSDRFRHNDKGFKYFIGYQEGEIVKPLYIILPQMSADRFRHNDKGFRYFIGYQEGEVIKPLFIILPQMNGYIKYF